MAVVVPTKGSNLIDLIVLFILSLHCSISTAQVGELPTQNWLNHGGNIYNTRYAEKEILISPLTASKLDLKWKLYPNIGVATTPAIYDGVLYFPSPNGYIYAFNASDGSQVWNQSILNLLGPNEATKYTASLGSFASRSTPTIAGDMLIVGMYRPAVAVALNMSTGGLVWSQKLDTTIYGVITMSGTYYNGSFYVGIASNEREALHSTEECCTFRGSFLKLNATTGQIIWTTYMLPDNFGNLGGYAGAALWESSPSIDVKRNHVYVATGNLFSAPLEIKQCFEETYNSQSDVGLCIEPGNHANSILALDLDTGEIKWSRQLGGYDNAFLDCFLTPSCVPTRKELAEIAGAPMILSVVINGTKKDVVSAAHQGGLVWWLDRDTGNVVRLVEAGPRGHFAGGGIWGAATDEKRIYTNIANLWSTKFMLIPSNENTTAGGWVAIDSADGRIVWSTADPSNGRAQGTVIIANGVLFGGSTAGSFYAMDAKTGKILWSYELGFSIYGGALVSNGCVYIGNGHEVFSGPQTSLFAFCVS